MYFLPYTMLHNPQTNTKYFKNYFKFKNLVLHYFRPKRSTVRSTVAITGQNGRPTNRPGLWPGVCTFVHFCRSTDRSTINSCGRPTERALLSVCVGRSTDSSKFLFRLFSKWRAGRPVGRRTVVQVGRTVTFWICFDFNKFQRSFFISKWSNSPQMTWHHLWMLFILCL